MCKEDTTVITVKLRRVCWVQAKNYERTPVTEITSTRIECGLKAGDAEKRFSFSLNLPNTPELVSCYRGHAIFYYYQLVAMCERDELFSVNLIASNALDESNRSLPINIEQPTVAVIPPKEYPTFVYAPPPGATPTLPQQPAGFITQPTSNVPLFVYTMGPQQGGAPDQNPKPSIYEPPVFTV